MADVARARKLAERIHQIVAQALQSSVKDPRLEIVTITSARITADLRDATVFYTVLGDETERAATTAALESAKGMLRSAVGRGTGVKFTPTLTFVFDDVADNVRHIDELLEQARIADEQVQQVATGAKYAGESNPYRVSSEAEVDEDNEISDEESQSVPSKQHSHH